MIRRIVCKECQTPLHREDAANGFEQRTVEIVTKKPDVHTITTLVDGKVQNVEHLKTLICDGCGKQLADGATAFAVTLWRPSREKAPDNWEQEYSQ